MGKIIAGIVGFIILVVVISLLPFASIGAGHRGVVTEFGKVNDTILPEGFHFISPFWSVHEYDVRTQKIETTANAASKDLQSVTTQIALNFAGLCVGILISFLLQALQSKKK